jgi:hypothetical protein
MTRILILIALCGLLLGTIGCETARGDREFIPGRGWVPVQ